MPDVFISHSSSDAGIVAKLADELAKAGLSVWDPAKIDPGRRWPEAIAKAIEDSKNVLVVLSDKASEGEWPKTETALALSSRSGKRVIPVFLSSSAIQKAPFLLRDLQGIDLSNPGDFAMNVRLLSEVLRGPPGEREASSGVQGAIHQAQVESLRAEHEKLKQLTAERETSLRATFASVSAVMVAAVTSLFLAGKDLLGGSTLSAFSNVVPAVLFGVVVGIFGQRLAQSAARLASRRSKSKGTGE